jgi:hypothetical protein
MHSLEAAEGHLSRVESTLNSLYSRFAQSPQPQDRYYLLVMQEALVRVQKARFELASVSTYEVPSQW